MAEVKNVQTPEQSEIVMDRARDFWTRYNKPVMIAALAIIVLGGGYLAYKYLYKIPQDNKAADAAWKAESYFRQDSLQKALKGDGQAAGFEKIIAQYGGTKAGNLAELYAGTEYLKQGDNNKAVEHLKKFSTGAPQIQARAYALLADAYANLNKTSEALDYYKKAAHHYEKDEENSANYLMMAGYYADKVMNKKDDAVALYKELKQKFPRTRSAFEVDKYLAQNGVYDVK